MGFFGKSFDEKVSDALEQIRSKGFKVRNLAAAVEDKVVTLTGECDDPGIKGQIAMAFNELVETENTLNRIQVVRPVQATVEPAVAAEAVAASAPVVESATVESATVEAAAAERVHEVVKGETLSKIAKQYYGNANKYRKIFDANRDQLDNPDLIKVGQKLRIPE